MALVYSCSTTLTVTPSSEQRQDKHNSVGESTLTNDQHTQRAKTTLHHRWQAGICLFFVIVSLAYQQPTPSLFASSVTQVGPFERWPTWISNERDHSTAIAPCDVNHDGYVDLINTNRNNGADGNGYTRLYLNTGGILATAASWTAELKTRRTEALAVTDLNRDGYCDIILGNDQQPLDVYLNQTGSFPARPSWSSAQNMTARTLAVGDIDGDTWPDVLIGGYDQPTQLVLNDQGVLSDIPAWTTTTSTKTTSLSLADVDQDGDLDLFQGNDGQPNALYLNQQGLFAAAPSWTATAIHQTTSMSAADINGDGWTDLVTAYYDAPLQVYYNQRGSFANTPTWTSGALTNTTSIVAGDVDGDGDQDVVAGGRSIDERNQAQAIALFLNQSGQLTSNPSWTSDGEISVSQLELFDLNNDFALDLVVSSHLRHQQVFKNISGALSPAPIWESAEIADINGAALADIDRDSDLDVLVGGFGPENTGLSLRLYRNDGGRLTSSPVWTSAPQDQTFQVAFGDYNGDGYPDLAVANLGEVRVYRNIRGTLTANEVWNGYDSALLRPNGYCLTWADMDGDGHLDLLVGTVAGETRVYLYRGENENPDPDQRKPRFELGWKLEPPFDWNRGIETADLDHDGDQDMVVANHGQSSRAFRNDGLDHRGKLVLTEFWRTNSISDNSRDLALTDINNDGWIDIVLANEAQPLRLYLNREGKISTVPDWSSSDVDGALAINAGDMDGNGFADLVVGNGSSLSVYFNQRGVLPAMASWKTSTGRVSTIALGDVTHDGALDIFAAQKRRPLALYAGLRARSLGSDGPPTISIENPDPVYAPGFSTAYRHNEPTMTIDYHGFQPHGQPIERVIGEFSLAGGGAWMPAVPVSTTQTLNLPTNQLHTLAVDYPESLPVTAGVLTDTAILTEPLTIADLDVTVEISHSVAHDIDLQLIAPNGEAITLVENWNTSTAGRSRITFDDTALNALDAATSPLIGRYRPSETLGRLHTKAAKGAWRLVVHHEQMGEQVMLRSWQLAIRPEELRLRYSWDIGGSGLMGISDNVVFRLTALPLNLPQANTVAGPYRYGAYSATTYPFSVQGTQVRVVNAAHQPVAGAMVYRLPKGSMTGGKPLSPDYLQATAFRTNQDGYLEGRETILPGDRLLALAPRVVTDTYTLYDTNGVPTETGLDAFEFTQPGLTTITVTPDHPLMLVNLSVSVEWDLTHDLDYRTRLETNLRQASRHIYDFTDGQVALGQVKVFQHADNWGYADVVVHASNRLRPFAAEGGTVITPTLDPVNPDRVYYPGQVHMGSIWNRYGTPSQNLQDDWALTLAHELGHYLLFLDDTYIGRANGLLRAVDSCTGSAMGDMYKPFNTEFIFDQQHWQTACALTLAAQEHGVDRTEWMTLQSHYPWMIPPTRLLSGPSLMPFNFTEITITPALTRTHPLEDPTFFVHYVHGGTSSTEGRAFLIHGNQTVAPEDDYLIDLGGPIGGQNRVLARGAAVGEDLCVFDRQREQFGCHTIDGLLNELHLRHDPSWSPVMQLTPVISTTYHLRVDGIPPGLVVKARLFPEYGAATTPMMLESQTGFYSGILQLNQPSMSGHIQVWVDETLPDNTPRREAIIDYAIGGNPGYYIGGGSYYRGGGGYYIGGGGYYRGGGGYYIGGGAPLLSSDGQMTVFTDQPFAAGEFFIIQSMAGLPVLPAGKRAVGQSYRLAAANDTQPITSSVTFQYLESDVLQMGINEQDLRVGFWNGAHWEMLPTEVDAYYNIASSHGKGTGVYALLSGQTTPRVDQISPSTTTTDVTTTLVISGENFLAPVTVALMGSQTYTLTAELQDSNNIRATVPPGLPAGSYAIEVRNGDGIATRISQMLGLYAPTTACFADPFGSGLGQWQATGEWAITTTSAGEHLLTDSPQRPYANPLPPTRMLTTTITSRPFSIADCPAPLLTFRHAYVLARYADSQDIGQVEISTDAGQTWQMLARYTGDSGGRIYPADTTAAPTTVDAEWDDADWQTAAINLHGVSGTTAQIRFSLQVDQHMADKGWAIDDLRIQSQRLLYLPIAGH